jgi:hypothetical protein
MTLNTGWTELNNALKELRLQWEETKAVWTDRVCQDFEEHHWNPLEAQVVATLRAMDRLAPVLTKAKQECS